MDSNHLPPRYQHGALPVELAAQVSASIARSKAGEPELYHGTNPASEAPPRRGSRSPNIILAAVLREGRRSDEIDRRA